MIRQRLIRLRIGAVTGLALGLTGVAHANVKDGVDAWAAGDFPRAIAEWKGPAAKGDADAMFNLAQAYRLGRGVPEDLKQAEALYARAAAKGHIQAADNYGLLLFQDGRREQAMPYVTAAADRGDPRAEYLLGIAYFNGDLVAKDWVRAYALLTLANGAGLPQAGPAIRQMDEFVPLAQRHQAQTLAARLRADADARRATQFAAADLGDGPSLGIAPVQAAAINPTVLPPARVPEPIASLGVAPSSVAAAEAAVEEAMRVTGTESPATAGADFARPRTGAPVARPAQAAVRAAPPPPKALVIASGGPWKLQLGAFSVAANADKLWGQLAGKPALAGKTKQTVAAGRLTRLLAAGWATEGSAQGACNALKASGQSCIVTR
jgi:cell division septation protein DedD